MPDTPNRRKVLLPDEVLKAEIKFLISQNLRLTGALRDLEGRNQSLIEQVRFLKTDQRSGVLREDVATEEIEKVVSTCRKYQTPLTIMTSDINSFKMLQDVRSHSWGDQAIYAAAKALELHLRPTDLILRKGSAGDEFILLMPGLEKDDAFRVRDRIENSTSRIEVSDGIYTGTISLTLGCATEDELNYQKVYSLADKDLIERKKARKVGR